MSTSVSALKKTTSAASASAQKAKGIKETPVKYEESKAVAELAIPEETTHQTQDEVPQKSQAAAGALSQSKNATYETATPKRPRSAYIMFSLDQLPKLIEEAKDENMNIINYTKKIGSMWSNLTEDQKAKFTQLHDEDVLRYQRQCEELKTKGYFIMDDGQKSSDVLVKVKKHRSSVKMVTRAVQTTKDLLSDLVRTEKQAIKKKEKVELGKRSRSEKGKSPGKVLREVSFGEQKVTEGKAGSSKRKKVEESPSKTPKKIATSAKPALKEGSGKKPSEKSVSPQKKQPASQPVPEKKQKTSEKRAQTPQKSDKKPATTKSTPTPTPSPEKAAAAATSTSPKASARKVKPQSASSTKKQ